MTESLHDPYEEYDIVEKNFKTAINYYNHNKDRKNIDKYIKANYKKVLEYKREILLDENHEVYDDLCKTCKKKLGIISLYVNKCIRILVKCTEINKSLACIIKLTGAIIDFFEEDDSCIKTIDDMKIILPKFSQLSI